MDALRKQIETELAAEIKKGHAQIKELRKSCHLTIPSAAHFEASAPEWRKIPLTSPAKKPESKLRI